MVHTAGTAWSYIVIAAGVAWAMRVPQFVATSNVGGIVTAAAMVSMAAWKAEKLIRARRHG